MSALMLGPLQELAHDPRICDVAVTCDGRVWVDQGEGMCEYHPHIPLRSPQVVREYAVGLCAQLGVRLDDAQPIADAANEDGVRVHAVIAPLVPNGAAISIRFPNRELPSLTRLCQHGLFPATWLPVLHGLVSRKATLLITGGTGVGKTTLLKALLSHANAGERIITVEEVRELGVLSLANHVSLICREANVEGAGAVGLGELVKATLRMRPDRVILGECRGEEIADLLRAYNSGHHGGMTTLHADSVERMPSRLITLGLLAGLLPEGLSMLAENAFDAVLHLERVGGIRRISQIGRLTSQGGRLAGETLASWQGNGPPTYSPLWAQFAAQWRNSVKQDNQRQSHDDRTVTTTTRAAKMTTITKRRGL